MIKMTNAQTKITDPLKEGMEMEEKFFFNAFVFP